MAQCLDIRRERFTASDRFLLDTNVAFDLVAPLGGGGGARRAIYASFFANSRAASAELIVSVLSFFEIAGVLEALRFSTVHGRAHTTRAELKAFRTNPAERARFIRELTSTWNEIASFATVAPAELAAGAPRDTNLPLLKTSTLDGYDPALVAEARRHRITTIVTHDSVSAPSRRSSSLRRTTRCCGSRTRATLERGRDASGRREWWSYGPCL